jgi:threonine synthase
LGEGFTPLVSVTLNGQSFLAKLEFLAPTGSFKDRGTTVLVSWLKALTTPQAHDDSSGNAAASLAAYCARAGISCTLYVPAYASPAKLRQIEAYGAKLVPVEGPRENAAKAAQEAEVLKQSYYASHAYHPLILEGTKTLAYELWEQLPRMPEAIVFPTGHGTFLLGTYRGLQDLQQAELIEELPKLIAVQSEACTPLDEAFHQGLSDVPSEWAERPSGETIAEGIRIPHSPRAPEVLQALRETGGTVVTVSDEEIQDAQRALARRGLLIEPTSAAAVAGWQKLLREGLLEPAVAVVIPLTGSGLKALATASAPAA